MLLICAWRQGTLSLVKWLRSWFLPEPISSKLALARDQCALHGRKLASDIHSWVLSLSAQMQRTALEGTLYRSALTSLLPAKEPCISIRITVPPCLCFIGCSFHKCEPIAIMCSKLHLLAHFHNDLYWDSSQSKMW